ncbi:MAG: transposase [Planctomycetales bacterium]|nr:transposase [Planctomycetales bacterium]
MPQSLAKVHVHLVYSTKERKPWLRHENLRKQLCAYKATILRNTVDSPATIINGVEDHIHILCLLSRKFAIKDVVKYAKTETTKWIKKQSEQLESFQWQAGYGAFSVSESNVPRVRDYIACQQEHHKRITFKDEFRRLCQRHGVEIDEQYVWD